MEEEEKEWGDVVGWKRGAKRFYSVLFCCGDSLELVGVACHLVLIG